MGTINGQNPVAALEYLATNNPGIKQVLEIIKKAGGDPMRAFEQEARERGLDPKEILDMIKG